MSSEGVQSKKPEGEERNAPAPAVEDTDGAASSNNKTAAARNEKKQPPANLKIPPPKPKLTKAERRALQEQQRAAKAAKQQQQNQKGGKQQNQQDRGGSSSGAASASHGNNKKSSSEATQSGASSAVDPTSPAGHHSDKENDADGNAVDFLSHLTPYQDPSAIFVQGATLGPRNAAGTDHHLHPAVIRLGHEYATGLIRGGNARCRAMLDCFSRVLQDYVPPPAAADATSSSTKTPSAATAGPQQAATTTTDTRHLLDQHVFKAAFTYWTEHCRPHSVSMGNAFSFLKTAVANLDRDCPLAEQQHQLLETIRAYATERIDYADRAIADLACEQLFASSAGFSSAGNDEQKGQEQVIVTYGHSEAVCAVLLCAAASKKKFRVICVDGRPLHEGRQMLHRLRFAGIPCTYILLPALTYCLQEVSAAAAAPRAKVLLGAAALMSDGSVQGRVGTACVALAAASRRIPVLVCSETYKISNRVQLESITGNELGDPNSVVVEESVATTGGATSTSAVLSDWKDVSSLRLVNLLYDLTPSDLVTGIVTELGIIPPSSVAVLLREMNPQS